MLNNQYVACGIKGKSPPKRGIKGGRGAGAGTDKPFPSPDGSFRGTDGAWKWFILRYFLDEMRRLGADFCLMIAGNRDGKI